MRARVRAGRRAVLACAAVGALAMLACGCAGAGRTLRPAPPALAGHPRVALLPLENLTGRPEAGAALTPIFFSALARTGSCELLGPGDVDAALDSLRIHPAGALAPADLRRLGAALRADLVMSGTVLENVMARTPDGDVPAIGVSLLLTDAASGRVLWAASRFRSGDDRETVFGWGRERSASRLASELASEMLSGFRAGPPDGPSTATGGSK
jgi:TolB-like protein